jgi:hypothetical protein
LVKLLQQDRQRQHGMTAVGQFGDMGVELVQRDTAGAVLVLAEAAIGEHDGAMSRPVSGIVRGDLRFGGPSQDQRDKAKCQAGGAAHRSGPKEHVHDHALSPGPFPASAPSVTQKGRLNKILGNFYRM